MQNHNDIKNKLLNSSSLKSLMIESKVYNELKDLGWYTEQSPFFRDSKSGKMRELDVKGRKYFQKEPYSCDVDILVECKSLKNYHIVANNPSPNNGFFDFIWTGNYTYNKLNKLDELLFKYNFNTEEIIYIKEKLENYCVLDSGYRWLDYKLNPFKIPVYNAYRETNVNTTKDIDNSVIWKCVLSLQSAILAHEELLLENIEYIILEHTNQDISKLKTVEKIIESLIDRSNHIYFIHPVIVVESKLWEFTKNNDLKELKYFRFNIQRFFENSLWVDIVNFEHIEEYLKKSNEYTSFHKERKFKNL